MWCENFIMLDYSEILLHVSICKTQQFFYFYFLSPQPFLYLIQMILDEQMLENKLPAFAYTFNACLWMNRAKSLFPGFV